MGRVRSATVACPCCGYRTLTQRAAYEVCLLCWWEDDGQDEHDADKIRGGPNGKESLTSARLNFHDHLTMYPQDADSRVGGADTAEEIQAKRALMAALDRLREVSPSDDPVLSVEIERAEAVLEAETDKKVRAYETGGRSQPA
jgi:cysteine-rich CPCC protein